MQIIKIGQQTYTKESYPRYSKYGTVVMSQEIYELLYGIIIYHSLTKAAKELGIAYSVAWDILRKASVYGALTCSKNKQGSEVTPYGLMLMEYWRKDVGYN